MTVINALKLMRLIRLVRVFKRLNQFSEYGAAVLLFLMSTFTLVAHWLACLYYAISLIERPTLERPICWLDRLAEQLRLPRNSTLDSGTKYLTALYFTFTTLTSIGFGNVRFVSLFFRWSSSMLLHHRPFNSYTYFYPLSWEPTSYTRTNAFVLCSSFWECFFFFRKLVSQILFSFSFFSISVRILTTRRFSQLSACSLAVSVFLSFAHKILLAIHLFLNSFRKELTFRKSIIFNAVFLKLNNKKYCTDSPGNWSFFL